MPKRELKLDWHGIRERWQSAPKGAKEAVLKQIIDELNLNMSVSGFRRYLRKEFGKTKAVKREPKIDKILLDEIADIKIQGENIDLTGRELSTKDCIDILKEEGFPGAESLTVSTVNRLLRKNGFRMRDPKIRYEANHVYQECQVDFSRSKYFQVHKYDKHEGDFLLSLSGKELHYKQNGARYRTWLVQLKDSFSRLRLIRAYAATGESAILGLEFLNWCFTRPEDAHLMHHVPERIKGDNGAFFKSQYAINYFDNLSIESPTSRPYNKDSQGKVENGWKQTWKQFELPLAIRMKRKGINYISLSEYNEKLFEYVVKEQDIKHPIYPQKRGEVFRKSLLQHPARIAENDTIQYAYRSTICAVKQDLTVRFENGYYEAPVFCIDKKIQVMRTIDGQLIGELLEGENKKIFALKPFKFREIDNFENRPEQTYRQKREQVIKAKKQPESMPAEDKNRQGNQIFFQPKTRKLTAKKQLTPEAKEQAFSSIRDAKIYIGKMLPDSYTYNDVAIVFDELLSGTLKRSEIDLVLNELIRNIAI